MGLKIAVAGKGGVGKTTIAGALARFFAKDGHPVLAIDADPSMSLYSTLGFPFNTMMSIVPISEMRGLIEERTRVDEAGGGFLILNPKVNDIPDRFCLRGPDGVKLLVMGTVRKAGGGCLCPDNALVKALLRHIVLERGELVILDMEAGLEHLGRATARGVDLMIVVVEPSFKSIEMAQRIKSLASSINIGNLLALGNKASNSDEENFIKNALLEADIKLLGIIPFDPIIIKADRMKIAPIDYAPKSKAMLAIKEVKEEVEKLFKLS